MRIAAIDQGTTSTRVLVAETGGEPRICASFRHAQSYPANGWVEHDPHELLANVARCLDVAGAVDAVGIDNQGESCLAWDAQSGEPLSAVIVWQDARTAERIDALKREGAEPVVMARSGLPLDPYFSASKLAWIVENSEPARAALAAGRLRLGTTDAFFLDRLTGRFVTDVTTASRTSLMNLERLEWDAELCRLFGVPLAALPPIVPTVGSFGTIGRTPVTCSVVDQQAALFGHGCRAPGDAKITFGTGAFALAVTGETIVRAGDRGLVPTVAWSRAGEVVRAVDGGVYDAGAAIAWARTLGLFSDIAEISTFDAPAAIDRDLAFVPALSGLACPYWDRSGAALWIGMTAATSRSDLCQALLEGIALRSAEVLATIDGQVPLGRSISVDGGLANNGYFCQFLADVSEREMAVPRLTELTGAGTAELAASGLGGCLRIATDVAHRYRPRSGNQAWRRERFFAAIARARAWRT